MAKNSFVAEVTFKHWYSPHEECYFFSRYNFPILFIDNKFVKPELQLYKDVPLHLF